MLTEGATREAVRLVGEYIPITDKEYKIMSEKLKTPAKKAPAAKAPAAKAPAAPKKAPAPPKEGSGRGRASTLDEKAKLALTEKGQKKVEKAGKDDKLALIAKAKTVGNALKVDGVLPKDIHYAVKVGLLELS
jgi:preprotein translocase subunit SecA